MSTTHAVTLESNPQTSAHAATVAYWIFTLWIAVTGAVAGVADILHLQPFLSQLQHLGYPAYFGSMLGCWKVLGAMALLSPRYPLLKEWAYAGLFFDFSSAVVSYSAAGGGAADFAGPVIAIGALAGSWLLRPESRRLTRGWLPG